MVYPPLLHHVLRENFNICPAPVRSALAYRHCRNGSAHCGCEHHTVSCYLNHALSWYEREFTMAKPNNKGRNTFTPTEFVQCQLTADDKKAFAKWRAAADLNLDGLVIEVLQTNHKIAFSFNGTTDSFICSVTGKPEDCNNANRCYTSHGKDYSTALWVALYKFHVIWKRGVWESLDTESDFG